jgi:hypothetical protein
LTVVFADKRGEFISIKGKKASLDKVEVTIKELLNKLPTKLAKQCLKNRDKPGYLKALGCDEAIHYPKYWQIVASEAEATPQLRQLSNKDSFYQEVLKLVLDTFDDKRVGVGFDAKNLTHTKLVVKSISAIENKFLFQQYYSKKKQLCLQSSVNTFRLSPVSKDSVRS